MKLKTYFFLFVLLLTGTTVTAQRTIRTNAVKSNNFGVVYSLPETSVVVKLKVKKTTYERGEFYQYSQRYLNIAPVTEDHTDYLLEDVIVVNRPIVDKANSYMVAFRSNAISPYVSLTEEGLIAAINDDVQLEKEDSFDLPEADGEFIDPTRYLPAEVLHAGSNAKRAELIAKQIFELRQSKNDILMGDADNMPPDGEAYKVVMQELNNQEQALTEMFTGRSQSEYLVKEYTVVPTQNAINKEVIARFSTKLGPVDTDNLAGEPIYLTLEPNANQDLPQEYLTNPAAYEKKIRNGIVYNIPGKAQVTIEHNNKRLRSVEMDVVQYGSKDVMTHKAITNKKRPLKIQFFPHLGAIKQITE